MMDELRRKLQGIPNKLTLLKADATSLPFEDDSFDVVLTVHLLHLIPAWREALAEIRRVLKPSGVFLYCHDRTNFYAFEAFEEQWKAILAHYGLQIAWYGAAREEVIQTLSQQGATLEQIAVAEWQSSRTVGQVLQAYQEKFLSSSWQIPDDIFPKAIQGLKAWALKNYGLEDTVISSRGKFELIVVHNWASK
jgi:SAM-dependent methyltransferase